MGCLGEFVLGAEEPGQHLGDGRVAVRRLLVPADVPGTLLFVEQQPAVPQRRVSGVAGLLGPPGAGVGAVAAVAGDHQSVGRVGDRPGGEWVADGVEFVPQVLRNVVKRQFRSERGRSVPEEHDQLLGERRVPLADRRQ